MTYPNFSDKKARKKKLKKCFYIKHCNATAYKKKFRNLAAK